MLETKLVLGRTFTWNPSFNDWECTVLAGTVSLSQNDQGTWKADLGYEINPLATAIGFGHSEADAILALQSQLRKMAELEVVE